jgi:hypothetical protein
VASGNESRSSLDLVSFWGEDFLESTDVTSERLRRLPAGRRAAHSQHGAGLPSVSSWVLS